jgi:gamma-aminobutyric acid type B receptor
MKDSQLFLVVGILLSIDIVIMTTWQVFDPFFRDTYDLRPYVSHINVTTASLIVAFHRQNEIISL